MKTPIWLLTLCLPLLIAATPPETANFAGDWTLQKRSSDSLDPLLKACGVGWFQRTAAAKIHPTVNIKQTPNKLTVTTQSIIDVVSFVHFDKKTRTSTSPLGRVVGKSHWSKDGKVLIDETTTTCKRNDAKIRSTIKRWLDDKGRMLTRIKLQTLPDGKAVSINRNFTPKK